ncbi:MAG: biotin--[acetyl-CoA-carboxylase] ligase [Bifidobacterium sp.]|uniref:biotin--[acetyl-CoA-carboxylase] ligase n=1 Tax=Bifidobacterium sp. TaxID=41200 RepID=UPI0039EAAF18
MPYQDCIWPSSVPETEEVASTVKMLDTVDSTNSLIARAVAASGLSDAVNCVAHLFESPEDIGEGEGTDTDRSVAGIQTPASSDHGSESSSERLPISIAVSDVQTKCRGRQGRTWFNSPGESLLSSWAVPVRIDVLDSRHSGWLTTICGIALIDAIGEVMTRHDVRALKPDAQLELKWPNDVFCQGRKLAGILCEMVPTDESSAVLIIGIGMNLFVPQENLPIDMSTSLQLQFGPLPPYAELRDELVCVTTQHLRRELSAFMKHPDDVIPDLRDRVERLSWTLGKQVRAHLADDRSLIGRALSINDDASLTILRHDGCRQKVTVADVGVLPEIGDAVE